MLSEGEHLNNKRMSSTIMNGAPGKSFYPLHDTVSRTGTHFVLVMRDRLVVSFYTQSVERVRNLLTNNEGPRQTAVYSVETHASGVP